MYLSGYAAVNLKDELNRASGVGTVTLLPEFNGRLRVWLDPLKLQARNLTAADVARALAEQNLNAEKVPAAGDNDGPIELIIQGRLVGPAEVEDVIVKAGAGGQVFRLKDMGKVEAAGGAEGGTAQLNGKDVALLAVAPTAKARPADVKAALAQKVAALEKQLPEGLRLEVAFDFTPNLESPGQRAIPEYLLLDVDLPPADAAGPRLDTALRDIAAALKPMEDTMDVLTLTDNPFDGTRHAPCVLVRLLPARGRKVSREEVAQAIRTRLDGKIGNAAVRVRFVLGAGPFAGWSYPLQLAVHGPEAEPVRKLAAKLAERLRQQKQLTDVWLDPATQPQPQLFLNIDREQAAKHGVRLVDLNDTLRIFLPGAPTAKQVEELKRLKVRNDQGEMVAVSTLVKAQLIEAPVAADRFDGKPMAPITANPAPDVPIAEARALCEKLARDVREELQLSADYRLSWLHEPQAK
jgi:multidrug efflux pump subunit AcrB